MSFYENDKFISLRNAWYELLKETGFNDLENPDQPDRFIQPEIINTRSKFGFTENYYQYCQLILRDFPFRRDVDRLIFELHTEGKSIREIEGLLPIMFIDKPFRKIQKSHIDRIIRRIKEDFGRV